MCFTLADFSVLILKAQFLSLLLLHPNRVQSNGIIEELTTAKVGDSILLCNAKKCPTHLFALAVIPVK